MIELFLIGNIISFLTFKPHFPLQLSHPDKENQVALKIFNNLFCLIPPYPTDKTYTAIPLHSDPTTMLALPMITQNFYNPINELNPAFTANKLANLNIDYSLKQGSLLSTTLLEKKFTLPLLAFAIPFFVLLFFRKQKKYAHNINVNIPSLSEKKVYRITLEKNHSSISTTFKVEAGKPIRLLQNENLPSYDLYDQKSLTLYNKKDSILKKFLWEPIATNILKHEQHFLILNINVKEVLENNSLENNPKTYNFYFSNKELIRINHLPIGFNKNQKKFELRDSKNDDSFNLCTITIDLHPTYAAKQVLHIPLPPFDPSAINSEKEFLHVEEL